MFVKVWGLPFLSNVVFGLYLEGTPATPFHQNTHLYLALVQSVLLYASETWTLTSADAKSLEAFHMKCQRRILRISWRQFVHNSKISALTGLPAINDVIRHRRIAVFGHIARLQDSTPAHKTLQSHVHLSLGHLPHPSWSRRPGRPRGRWIDQIRNDTSQTPADLWRQALGRGHHGRAMRRPTLAMRWWWSSADNKPELQNYTSWRQQQCWCGQCAFSCYGASTFVTDAQKKFVLFLFLVANTEVKKWECWTFKIYNCQIPNSFIQYSSSIMVRPTFSSIKLLSFGSCSLRILY